MNCYKISMFAATLCVLGLGFSDTASGQIEATPSGGMSFQVQSGNGSATQTLNVTTVQGATTLVVTVPSNQVWLQVANNTPGTTFYPNAPAALAVTVNTGNFSAGQTLTANITIAIYGQPSTAISYPVSLTVGTPSLLSASPAALSFSGIQGASAGTPNPSTVLISSSGTQLGYTVSASTANNQNWLLLQNTTGATGGTGFEVYVDPAQLAVGSYTGQILVQSTTTGDSVTIPVTLSVTAGSTLNVTGTLNNFIYQYGSGGANINNQSQTLMVSSSAGTLNYSVTPSATAPQTTNWLVVTPNGGTATGTPQNVVLTLSPQYVEALSPGTYTIQLAIAPTGPADAANTTNETVTLVVSNNPLLSVNAKSLMFTAPFGSSSVQQQTVTVSSSTGASIPYMVTSNAFWVQVNPSTGTTTANPSFQVIVNPSSLAVSSTPYTATLTVSPTNSDAGLYSIPIAISLTVTSQVSQVFAGPSQLLFSYQTTQSVPPVQLVQLTGTSTVGFTVSTSTMNGSNCPTTNWLTATPSQTTTPATLSVSVATSGMTSGFCTGSVSVTYNNGSNPNAQVNIPVVVDIAATPLLTVTPPFGFGVVTATYGSTATIPYSISINSTDGSALGFSAYASTPGAPSSWLFLGSSSGTTQQYLQVNISPGGLPIGVYNGTITIHASNSANLPSGDLVIPVVLTISSSATVSVSPTSLTFTEPQSATTPPAAQTISLTATGGTSGFTATVVPVTGGGWLQVTPASGTATGSITASVAPNQLSPGTYSSNIVLNFLSSATATTTIPVTLIVTQAQVVTPSSTSLSFAYQLGGTAPAAQTLNLTSTGGTIAVTAVAATTSGPTGWLAVSPSKGSTGTSGAPLALTVSVATGAFTAAGNFAGTITVTPTGESPISIPVTIAVTGVAAPQPSTISNSASGQFGPIAPGELITIKGTALGPATPASFTLATASTVSNTLSGVQVLFDGIAGTPTYVSATQINVIVPYEIAGRASTNVVVSYENELSAAIPQTVASQAPGIYTESATGSGQASVLNQNGSLNGPSSGLVINGTAINTTPAAAGSVIAVYMTGGGQTNPASVTGSVTPTNTLYKIPGTVTATINGVNATVEFAGAAPGLVTGVIQVNILVPSGVSGNAQSLVITINGTSSLTGPTVAIQ